MKADTLKRRRESLGYSQEEFASILRVHAMTVSKWERGLHRVPEAVALLIRQMHPEKGGRPKQHR